METEALVLSPLSRSDYGWLCELYADPEVMRYIGTGVRSPKVAATALDKMLVARPPSGYWTLRDRTTNAPLGGIMLMVRKEGSPLELGFLLARPAWGRGLATQAVRAVLANAFSGRDVPLIEAYTDARNEASAKVLRKAGFRDLGLSAGPYGGLDRKWSVSRDERLP
jgi:RimJ/RimL family protein N-acetyltransferase